MLGDLPAAIMVFQPMSVRQIGPHGVQVETRVPLHVDSLHELRLTLGPRTVVVKGRVVHCRIHDVDQEDVVYGAGLEFTELSSHAEEAIAAYLSSVRAERRQNTTSDR